MSNVEVQRLTDRTDARCQLDLSFGRSLVISIQGLASHVVPPTSQTIGTKQRSFSPSYRNDQLCSENFLQG